jgi:hypothetical protein
MSSYVFQVELAHEDDGRWSMWIDVLPGCAAWGYTRKRHCRRPRRASGTLSTGTLRNVPAPRARPPRRRHRPRRRLRCAHGSGQARRSAGECGLDRRRRMGEGRTARGDSGRMPRERRPGAVRKRGGLASGTHLQCRALACRLLTRQV